MDPGIIHPFAVAGPDGHGLVVSGRAIRAETRLHLSDTKQRAKATARRSPARRPPGPGRVRSRRWNKTLARQRDREAAHRRRVRQAQHEAAAEVVGWCPGAPGGHAEDRRPAGGAGRACGAAA
ncbi:MAG TPA: hypothetical protein VHY58_02225 [Streptosporangiaceae bacterium]|nr:hypothetical protein [Streptosporangiaceae bacterium]